MASLVQNNSELSEAENKRFIPFGKDQEYQLHWFSTVYLALDSACSVDSRANRKCRKLVY